MRTANRGLRVVGAQSPVFHPSHPQTGRGTDRETLVPRCSGLTMPRECRSARSGHSTFAGRFAGHSELPRKRLPRIRRPVPTLSRWVPRDSPLHPWGRTRACATLVCLTLSQSSSSSSTANIRPVLRLCASGSTRQEPGRLRPPALRSLADPHGWLPVSVTVSASHPDTLLRGGHAVGPSDPQSLPRMHATVLDFPRCWRKLRLLRPSSASGRSDEERCSHTAPKNRLVPAGGHLPRLTLTATATPVTTAGMTRCLV